MLELDEKRREFLKLDKTTWLYIKNMTFYEYEEYLYKKYRVNFSDCRTISDFYDKNVYISDYYILFFEILKFESKYYLEFKSKKYDLLSQEIKDCVENIRYFSDIIYRNYFSDFVAEELYERAMDAIEDLAD